METKNKEKKTNKTQYLEAIEKPLTYINNVPYVNGIKVGWFLVEKDNRYDSPYYYAQFYMNKQGFHLGEINEILSEYYETKELTLCKNDNPITFKGEAILDVNNVFRKHIERRKVLVTFKKNKMFIGDVKIGWKYAISPVLEQESVYWIRKPSLLKLEDFYAGTIENTEQKMWLVFENNELMLSEGKAILDSDKLLPKLIKIKMLTSKKHKVVYENERLYVDNIMIGYVYSEEPIRNYYDELETEQVLKPIYYRDFIKIKDEVSVVYENDKPLTHYDRIVVDLYELLKQE